MIHNSNMVYEGWYLSWAYPEDPSVQRRGGQKKYYLGGTGAFQQVEIQKVFNLEELNLSRVIANYL
jgi:hypothetical protein